MIKLYKTDKIKRYCVTSIVGGVLFAILDGVINANPFAQRLFAFYKPIVRSAVNAPLGIVVDLYRGLPGSTHLVKGITLDSFTNHVVHLHKSPLIKISGMNLFLLNQNM